MNFSTFSLKFKGKICVRKEVIHNLKKSHFGQVTSYDLTHFRKMVRAGLKNQINIITSFCLRYDTLMERCHMTSLCKWPVCERQTKDLRHVREPKTVLDSGFYAVDSGFLVLDCSLCQ